MDSKPQLSIVKGPQRELIPRKLNRIFEDNLRNYSNKTALIFKDEKTQITSTTTYCTLNETSNQIARIFLRETRQNFLKSNQDDDFIIAVCMQPNDRLLTILLSIWKAGAAYLPIDPSFPVNRIHHILNESKPIMVICDDDIDTSPFGSTLIHKSSNLFEISSRIDTTNINDCDMLSSVSKNLGIVLYTSGSTGIPKGVRLSHSSVLNRLQWQWENFPYTPNEMVGVFKTALTFVDSITEIWGPLLSGMAVLVIPKDVTKDPEKLVDILEQYKIRRLVLVPTLLRTLLMYLKMNKEKFKLLYNLEMWVCSGEPLSLLLAKSFFDYFEEGTHVLYNFYGSTEIMGDVTYFACESQKQLDHFEKVPIGQPLNNTVIYLLDPDYRPVKKGEIGEIFVAGLNLADGYVNNRDAHRFIENPLAVESKYSRIYRTGDFGSIQNGWIMYEGRTDSQIKIRGHRVDLSEVEKNVLSLEIVEKAIVLCYHVGEIDQTLLTFVKLNDNQPLCTGLQIEGALEDKLASYMIPQVIIIDNVPLLVNGKVDRQALIKSYESANNNDDDTIILDFDYSLVPDELKLIATDVFETVGSVIGRSTRATLSAKSNFYELGGNSLNSIYTVTLLREKGYYIGISDFIAAKNLGEILYKISKNDRSVPMEEDFIAAVPHLNMESYKLKLCDKEIIKEIIVESFHEKADLENWLKPDINRSDYSDIIEEIWETLVSTELSFLVKDLNSGRVIGTALNFDARDEPEVEVKSKLKIIFDFLEDVEGPVRDNYLPKGKNTILHSFMMGTYPTLNAQENIACMHFMESEVLKIAKERKFIGILTTNTSPLTQQLGSEVYNYKTMLDYQVNEYVCSDGSKPFRMAPNSQRAIVHWKEV